MAINELQFTLLRALLDRQPHAQRSLSRTCGISLGKVNRLLQALRDEGMVDARYVLTDAGEAALAPYRVKNAVIMAAGMSTRFAPLSYERPKALLRVKGEILIEREIRQLREAGISEIIVVVGYMKEQMYYLAEKFGVELVVNEDYYRYNNPSSLYKVLERLDNTYICSSDNYFTENVFESYVYRPYYAAVYSEGPTDEYCLRFARDGRIEGVSVGGSDSWYMLGHVYWDRAFSGQFVRILRACYEDAQTRYQLWENLYMRHIDELALYIRQYPDTLIKEFDSLDELRAFDSHYISNADSKIFRNISAVLGCESWEIGHIIPIKAGLTNISFKFECRGKAYVYRHPGPGTEKYINRQSEAASMEIARALGLDDTFIYMDAAEGWKLSHYIESVETLDYGSREKSAQALSMLRRLHTSGRSTAYRFDVWAELDKFYEVLHAQMRDSFEGAAQIKAQLAALREYVDADGVPQCLCHGDSYSPNFLSDGERMYLIDWEYSGMADPAVDIGTFIACSPYDMEQADAVIAEYLGHEPSASELRHYLGYVAILSYYWFVWSLYQDCIGKPVGEWQYLWYKATRAYADRALQLYRA